MKQALTRWLDKAFDRFSLALLARADERLLHPNRLLLLEAQREAADYVKEHMAEAIVLKTQAEILGFALSRAPESGLLLEFGVGNGESTRTLAGRTSRTLFGFDSFTGLPEDWAGRHEGKGHYSTGGVLPVVPANAVLKPGLFADSLPPFLAENGEPVAFLHVDCDLYSSTTTILTLLGSRIRPGTIIVFDEYFNYPSWRRNEFKAFQEFVAAKRVNYRYIAWAYQQAAVQIL